MKTDRRSFVLGFFIGFAVFFLFVVALRAGVFDPPITCFHCVANPLGEITGTVRAAQAGEITSAQGLCFRKADLLSRETINNQLTGVEVVSMECSADINENQICSGASAKLSVTNDHIEATDSAQFKARACCGPSCRLSSNSECKLTIFNA